MEDISARPDYLGHRQRIRRRFLLGEGKDMADYELLELALTMAIPRRDVKPLAKTLIKKFGSFAGVVNASQNELAAVEGVKENTITMLKLIKAAALRTSWQNLNADDTPVINSFDSLVDYCRSAMAYGDIEEFRIIYLNTKLRLIGEETMQKGTINSVSIHPREVIKSAMEQKAAAIIMVHNHPSGDTTPSKADIEMTKAVARACRLVNITLLDHLIISRSSCYSFAEHIDLKNL